LTKQKEKASATLRTGLVAPSDPTRHERLSFKYDLEEQIRCYGCCDAHSTSAPGHERRLTHPAATSAITLNADIRLRRNI